METEPLLTRSVNRVSVDYGSWPDNAQEPRDSHSAERNYHYIQQAVVFIEDAIQYRSINHRVDSRSLYLYRWYYSKVCQWGLVVTITVILALAFIERPSSLSLSSDPRYRQPPWETPCGVTEGIEMICLIVFTLDLTAKSYLIGWEEFRKRKWLIAYSVVIAGSTIDWVLSVSMICDERCRIRRLFRPFFLLQYSTLMKETLKSIKRTLPEIACVILLLALHLCLFTMVGLLLFAKTKDPDKNGEWESYFKNLPLSLTSLLVLLTTANNPDVMIPAYSLNRVYALFFTLFSVCGTYLLMNLLTAIIYNQFRGYLLMSIQTAVLRRRLGIRAAFEVLRDLGDIHNKEHVESIPLKAVLEVLRQTRIEPYQRVAITTKVQQSSGDHIPGEVFQRLFDALDMDQIKERPPMPEYSSLFLQKLQFIFTQRYIVVAGNVLALANIMCICTVLVIDSENPISKWNEYHLEVINFVFVVFYLLEMLLKIFSFGLRGYLSYNSNVFDGLLTVTLLVLQISIFSSYSVSDLDRNPAAQEQSSLWEMMRLVNMLIVFRFLRIIPNVKLMSLVSGSLVDLVKNLRAFAGILLVIYYAFAVFGIWLFEGAISPTVNMSNAVKNSSMAPSVSNYTVECGSYEQLGYWSNNFDDFASALVLLYNVMVVNNWQVFLDVYSRYTTEWSKVYFVSWWLTSSVIWVNLFVALILENFTYKWDRSHGYSVSEVERTRYQTSVQLMFREQIQEPTEEELLAILRQHPHLHLHLHPSQ